MPLHTTVAFDQLNLERSTVEPPLNHLPQYGWRQEGEDLELDACYDRVRARSHGDPHTRLLSHHHPALW